MIACRQPAENPADGSKRRGTYSSYFPSFARFAGSHVHMLVTAVLPEEVHSSLESSAGMWCD